MKYNRNVILTGLTSFFTDVSSEMLYPLIQAFVSTVLASQKALIGPALGIIEGVAESTASLLKVLAGYYSDRIRLRKAPTIAGYALSALSKLLLFLTSSGWYFVLVSRFFDRMGKGVRTAPRDALIYESTEPGRRGAAFGYQRAMDFAGATLGVAVCWLVCLQFLDPVSKTLRDVNAFYTLFAVSVVPAFIGVVFLFFVREPRPAFASEESQQKPTPNLDLRKYDRNLRLFFLAQCFFTLGNSSNQFLFLRSMNLGIALPAVILMYLLFNLSSTVMSRFFGGLSDKIGRRKILIAGYALYAAVYCSFGLITRDHSWVLWICWIVYGVYYAMTEGVEKAFVGDLSPEESKATALGFFYTIVGIGLLPASVIAGFLFSLSPAAPFIFGSCMSGIALVIVALFVKETRHRSPA
ncbi:MAG TPA: MFS transporter [Chitinivibrionales bacterium]|jgi:MFS family permease|nr:MFS transporter [Chitinivibrionales bacterium]